MGQRIITWRFLLTLLIGILSSSAWSAMANSGPAEYEAKPESGAEPVSAQTSLSAGGGTGPAAADTLWRPALAWDSGEGQILAVIREVNKYLSVSEKDGRLLRLLAESIDAKRIVEIGTSTGFSGLWFCLALRKTGGELITHEIDPERAAEARSNFKNAGVESLVTIIEGNAHENVRNLKDPIDLLFLDADKAGYPDYLEKLLPLVRPGGLIVAHNMRNPSPDPDYIDSITNDPRLESLFLLMDGAGVGVTLKKR